MNHISRESVIVVATEEEILLKPKTAVPERELQSLRSLAERKRITKKQLVAACREIGETVYSKEFE